MEFIFCKLDTQGSFSLLDIFISPLSDIECTKNGHKVVECEACDLLPLHHLQMRVTHFIINELWHFLLPLQLSMQTRDCSLFSSFLLSLYYFLKGNLLYRMVIGILSNSMSFPLFKSETIELFYLGF